MHSSEIKQLAKMDRNELFELILNELGGFGRFQIRLLLLSLIASFLCALNHLGAIYLAFAPKFSCDQGSEWDSQCPANVTSIKKANCTFDQSVMKRTIVTDFDLNCDRLPLLPLSSSSYMVGVMIVNSLAGFMADRVGRRKIMLSMSCLHILATFLTAFSSSSYWFFVAARFFVGGAIHATWTSVFVITAEVTVEQKRGLTGGVVNSGWNLGSMLLTLLAFLLRDWTHMQLTMALTSLFLISYYFLIPESPRWLIQQGRFEEAEAVLRTIGEANGLQNMASKDQANTIKANDATGEADVAGEAGLTSLLAALRVKEESAPKWTEGGGDEKLSGKVGQEEPRTDLDQPRQRPAWDLFRVLKHPSFRNRLLLLSIPWFCVGMSSYGIHFSVKLIEFDIFILSILKELAILTLICILIPIYDRTYRTITLSSLHILCGLFGLSFLVVSTKYVLARTIMFLIVQALCVGNFFLIDTYTHEVFSTDTRSFAFALLDSISKLGTTIAPFVVDLGGNVNPSLPPAVFGMVMMVAAVVYCCTPETRKRPLTQNVEDLGHERTLVKMAKKKLKGAREVA